MLVERAGFIKIPHDLMPKAKELPGDLRSVAEVVGVVATIKLAQAFRGTTVYFRNIDEFLRKKRNVEIRNAFDNGTRVRDIARKHRLSSRQIETILRCVNK